VNFERR